VRGVRAELARAVRKLRQTRAILRMREYHSRVRTPVTEICTRREKLAQKRACVLTCPRLWRVGRDCGPQGREVAGRNRASNGYLNSNQLDRGAANLGRICLRPFGSARDANRSASRANRIGVPRGEDASQVPVISKGNISNGSFSSDNLEIRADARGGMRSRISHLRTCKFS
jgi:hypothetical protein